MCTKRERAEKEGERESKWIDKGYCWEREQTHKEGDNHVLHGN